MQLSERLLHKNRYHAASVIASANNDDELTTALLELSGNPFLEHPSILSDLLCAGASICARDGGGLTACHRAAFSGSARNVNALRAFMEAPEPLPRGAYVTLRSGRRYAVTGFAYLHLAAAFNPNPAVIDALVASEEPHAGSVIDRVVADGRYASATPLHLATTLNSAPAVARTLIALGANVHARLAFAQRPALHVAARVSAETFEILLDAGADPASVDTARNTILHAAVFSLDDRLIHRITALGDYHVMENRLGHTPIERWARVAPRLRAPDDVTIRVTTALVEAGVSGLVLRSALRLAQESADAAVTEVLGSAVEARRRAPLAEPRRLAATRGEAVAAARRGDTLKLTASHGPADGANHVDENGVRLLTIAAARGHLSSVQRLIEHGADVAHRHPVTGMTALDAACKAGFAGIAALLIKSGSSVHARDPSTGRSPLHYAASSEVVDVLCGRGADPDARDHAGQTPLHGHVASQVVDAVTALLDHGADPNAARDDGETPLSLALEWCNGPWIVGALLRAGADVDAMLSRERGTPLDLAVAKASLDVIELLLAHGARPNEATDELHGCSLLTRALKHGQWRDLIPALLAVGADPNAPQQDTWGGHLLHALVTRPSSADVVRAAIAAGADARHSETDTTLGAAALLGSDPDVVTVLVEAGVDPNDPGEMTATPISNAVASSHAVAMTRALLDHGAVVTLERNSEYAEIPAFHDGAAGLRLCRMLLDVRSAWSMPEGTHLITYPLGSVQTDVDHQIGTMLRDAGVKVDCNDELYRAIISNDVERIRQLARCGSSFNLRLDKSLDLLGETPLIAAARNATDPATMSALLDGGASIGTLTEGERNVLHIAGGKAPAEIVRLLVSAMNDLSSGWDVFDVDQYGHQPIHYAAMAGKDENLRVLIESGSPLDDIYPGWQATPLDYAAANAHIDAVRVLLAAGADPSVGAGVVAEAVAGGSDEAVAVLVAAGAPLDVPAKRHGSLTALALAASTGRLEIVRLLLTRGADPDGAVVPRLRPIEMAVHDGPHHHVIRVLSEAGATIRPALVGFCMQRHDIATVLLLLELGGDPNAIDDDGYSLLHRALLDDAEPSTIEALLAAGAQSDVEARPGATALLTAARYTKDATLMEALLEVGKRHLTSATGRRLLLIEASANPSISVRRSVVQAVTAARKAMKAM